MELQQETTQTGASEGRQFIGGEWVDAAGGRHIRVARSLHRRRRRRTSPPAGARTLRAPSRPPRPRSRSGRRRRPQCARGSSSRPPTSSRRGRTRSSRCWRARRGSTFGFAMFQAHVFVPGLLRQAAALAYAPLGEVIPSDTGAFSMGLRRPVGVVGAIAPWNAALILSARSIAAPLALGNTVVLKPSELSPIVGGLIWGEIFTEAGPAARRPEHRHARSRRGRPDRRRTGREPARAQAQLHRLDRRPDASSPRRRAGT